MNEDWRSVLARSLGFRKRLLRTVVPCMVLLTMAAGAFMLLLAMLTPHGGEGGLAELTDLAALHLKVSSATRGPEEGLPAVLRLGWKDQWLTSKEDPNAVPVIVNLKGTVPRPAEVIVDPGEFSVEGFLTDPGNKPPERIGTRSVKGTAIGIPLSKGGVEWFPASVRHPVAKSAEETIRLGFFVAPDAAWLRVYYKQTLVGRLRIAEAKGPSKKPQ